MQKAIVTVTITCLILVAWLTARAQVFSIQTNTIVTVPPVVWRGINAQVIASQLLGITNTDGSLVIPPGLFTNRSSTIGIRVEVGTNGVIRSIRAKIQ